MRNRNHRTSRALRSSARQRRWVHQSGTAAAVAVGTASVNALVGGGVVIAGVSSVLGATVARTIVTIQIPYVVAADSTTVGLVVGRDTDPGFNIPDPTVEQELLWAWNEVYFATSQGAGATVNTLVSQTLDVKSKRKLRAAQDTYVLSIHNGNAAAATYKWDARILLLLP